MDTKRCNGRNESSLYFSLISRVPLKCWKSTIVSEANELPFKDNYFDKCFSWGVFLYFPSWEYTLQALKEMERVMKGSIFSGELPKESHDTKHQLYAEKQFVDLVFDVERGWLELYCDVRLNAIKTRN
ncbi:MAG: methyltransferase domain-containing protein [Lachnospiraceae bacterium]|nr:methyltransferase domain-containing protein [Lachnospiraceae bacterium]